MHYVNEYFKEVVTESVCKKIGLPKWDRVKGYQEGKGIYEV